MTSIRRYCCGLRNTVLALIFFCLACLYYRWNTYDEGQQLIIDSKVLTPTRTSPRNVAELGNYGPEDVELHGSQKSGIHEKNPGIRKDDQMQTIGVDDRTNAGRKTDKNKEVKTTSKDEEKNEVIRKLQRLCNRHPRIAGVVKGDMLQNVYRLKSVHIIIRHGMRAPASFRLQDIRVSPPSCQFNMSQLSPIETRYVTAMRRFQKHLPKVQLIPNQAQCTPWSLTPAGALQHLENGINLRKTYVDNQLLLTSNYSSRDIYAVTTLYPRTIMSAMALLYGLLPDFSPNNTKLGFLSTDTSMCSSKSGVRCNCPKLREPPKMTKRINETLAGNIKQQLAGLFSSSESKTIAGLAEPLLELSRFQTCEGRSMPCVEEKSKSASKKCVTSSLLSNIFKQKQYAYKFYKKDQAYQLYNTLTAHPLLNEIGLRLRMQSKGLPTPKIGLYSGHDQTLSPVLVSLGIDKDEGVPLAATLVLELYQRKKKSKQETGSHFIRVLYNGVDRTKELRFCTGLEAGKDGSALCPLSKFLEHTYVVNKDYAQNCKSGKKSIHGASRQFGSKREPSSEKSPVKTIKSSPRPKSSSVRALKERLSTSVTETPTTTLTTTPSWKGKALTEL